MTHTYGHYTAHPESEEVGQTGLHKLWHPGILAVRKWRENEEIKRKWWAIDFLHFLILSSFPPSFSISSFPLHFLPLSPFLTTKYGTFVANVTEILTYVQWGNNSGSNLLRWSSASCAGLGQELFSENVFDDCCSQLKGDQQSPAE